MKLLDEMIRSIKEWSRNQNDNLFHFVFAALFTILTCSHYLYTLFTYTNIGFALDDSWIHLEYARSIFEGRAWQYVPDFPSTGSTSPLWSILLSGLFIFTTDPTGLVWGVMIISILLYIINTYIVGLFVTKITESKPIGIVAMFAFVMIPRNSWLMLSGMEYPIFLFFLFLPLLLIDRPEPRYDLILGFVAGFAFLSRPEGVLVALIIFPLRIILHLWNRDFSKKRLASVVMMFVSALLIVLPWILYCLATTGYPLPDTFYAKSAPVTPEMIARWDLHWTFFFLTWLFIPVGLLLGVSLLFKKQPYPWLFALSLTLLYRMTMPSQVLINNTRYLVPIFSFLLISCVCGIALIINRLDSTLPKHNLINRDLISTVLILLIVIIPIFPSYFYQATYYGLATKNINEMQVNIGFWLQENTPDDAVIALGDVGAIRYFSDREIVDLVGLVTPEITHGNFTSVELAEYLELRGVTHLIIFQKHVWYYVNYLQIGDNLLYNVTLTDNVICGGPTMLVYDVIW
ncbi:MAG: hypothetical protein ACTSUB_08325 [Candidatus Thorarchaeota archaeon]